DRFLILPDDFHSQVAGAGIEPTSRRSERRILPLDDPATQTAGFRLETAGNGSRRCLSSGLKSPVSGLICGGRNRTCALVVQSHGFLPAETTPHCERDGPPFGRCPDSNPRPGT